jgi:catechol 2,3-dioxygenase-like lactoylglutathione lyase family enzyme
MAQHFVGNRDVIIRTRSLATARAHYGGPMGFSLAYESPTLLGFETGAFRLYVEEGPAHGPVFEMLVEDVPAAKAQMLAAGCTLVEEETVVPRCYVRDPFGLTFNIGQRAE